MSRRSQDIPIRPRYGYAEEGDGEESSAVQNRAAQSRCGATPASYSEIPFLAQYAGPVPEHVLQDITPTAGGKPPTLGSESYVNLDSGEEENDEDDDEDDDEEEEQSNSNSKDSSGEATHKAASGRPKSLQSCRCPLPPPLYSHLPIDANPLPSSISL